MPNPPLFQLDHALEQTEVRSYRAELENLQGNILKTHGRGAAVHVFLTFRRGKKIQVVKEFLRQFATDHVTSAAEQLRQIERYKKARKRGLVIRERPGHPLGCLCLSAKGYRYLGLSTDRFSREFAMGMRARRTSINDPSPDTWESKFQRRLDAMIILADDRVEHLTEQLGRLHEQLDGIAHISVEFGLTMRNEAENPIEHFGYVDGISQPLFFTGDLRTSSKKWKPPKGWNPLAAPNLVLVKDPYGGSQRACGTYFVFRKLEQNVRGFKAREEELADELDLHDRDDRERAGAMVVGRFEDGTPLASKGVAGTRQKPQNNFNYERDSGGNRCPFSAHIRITNPRTDNDKQHRIARRGITYGDPTPPGDDLDALPEGGVGLLFQCCQADLKEQFEYLQRLANQQGPPRPGGLDPLIGQSNRRAFPRLEFPSGWDRPKPVRQQFSFHGFVKLKGGEYFFMPSISFCKNLR